MGSPPFAFSVHNFISSVGADAGFAAIIGLAVLVLLYFAHARETANLREEAAMLAARLQQAEARVAELSRPQPVAAAVPVAEGVQVTDRRGVGSIAATAPFAPAGMGAPALASATRVVPVTMSSLPDEVPAHTAPAVASPALPVPAAAPASAAPATAAPARAAPASAVGNSAGVTDGAGSTAVAQRPPAPDAGTPAVPGPVTAGAIPGPLTAAAANGAARAQRGLAGSPAPSRAPAGSGAKVASRGLSPLGAPAQSGSSTARRIVLGLFALLLVAAAAVALVVITSSTRSNSSSSHVAATTNAPAASTAGGFTPAAVTVAVLNGTATNRLAHRVAAKLKSDGYRDGRITTAANQTVTTTIVAYLPGSRNRTDALHVATALSLKPSAVQPIDTGTQQVACPSGGTCGANVVVTVGADLATL